MLFINDIETLRSVIDIKGCKSLLQVIDTSHDCYIPLTELMMNDLPSGFVDALIPEEELRFIYVSLLMNLKVVKELHEIVMAMSYVYSEPHLSEYMQHLHGLDRNKCKIPDTVPVSEKTWLSSRGLIQRSPDDVSVFTVTSLGLKVGALLADDKKKTLIQDLEDIHLGSKAYEVEQLTPRLSEIFV